MSNNDDRDTAFAVQRLQRVHDVVRIARIEIARRLVGKEHARIINECPSDSDTLLLAPRKLARRIESAIGETEQTESFPRAFEARSAGRAIRHRVEQRQGDVFDRAGAGQQVEALKDETKPFTSQLRELGLAELRHVDTLEGVATAGRPIEAAEDRHQGGLARSGRPHDGDKLAALDDEVHPAKGVHVNVTDAVNPRDVLDFDGLFRHRRMFRHGHAASRAPG